LIEKHEKERPQKGTEDTKVVSIFVFFVPFCSYLPSLSELGEEYSTGESSLFCRLFQLSANFYW